MRKSAGERVVRRTGRTALLLIVLGALGFVAACGPAAPPPPSSPAAADIVARHDAVRAANGLGGLAVDGGLQANAQFHANRLAAGVTVCSAGALWHSPELGSWYWGYSAGENVACVPGCPSDGRMAMTMWLESPPHRANILNPAYALIGVASACNASVQLIVVQYRSG